MSHRRRKVKDSLGRVTMIAVGIAVNCALGFVIWKSGLPLYLDSVGTIGVTLIAGVFPGIVTGVITNVICSLFNPYALYYSLVSALIAILSSRFYYRYSSGNRRITVLYILLLALTGGVIGTLFQYILLGEPQFAIVREVSGRISHHPAGVFCSVMLINIGFNLIDKSAAVLAAMAVTAVIPADFRTRVRNSPWKQTPLSSDEMSRIGIRKKGSFSLYKKVSATLIFVALLLSLTMGWLSLKLYQKNVRKEYAENALHAARLAAMVIDTDRVEDYIRSGRNVPGYSETEEKLYRIRENSQGVKYLYITQIREDGCYIAFDLETEDTKAYAPGDIVAFEDAFRQYLPALFAGEEIPPIESNDISGWVLTAYYPVRDSAGNTVCYAGVDVSMGYLSEYVRDYLSKTILIFSGLFVLIIGFGLWVSGYALVYPIGSMTECTKAFALNSEDREAFDRNVRMIRKLDIRTNDEVEELYQSICKMSVDMADQVRNIKRFAEATSQMQNGLIMTMADMVENRDSDTGMHIQKTAEYVRILLDGLKRKGYYTEKITDKFVSDVIMSAPLHDVGKISISDTILNKPGRLTSEEFEIMKTHTTAGREIIEKAISTVHGENYLKEARYMAAYHHERWDGKGYPEGLYQDAIPLSARIMAVADVFDALTSRRVYKPAFSIEQSVEIMKEGSGTQFDPKCIEVFLEDTGLLEQILEKYRGMNG